MTSKISGSVLIAIVLAIGVGLWMFTGDIVIGGQSESGATAVPIAEREAKKDTELFKVRYSPVTSTVRQEFVTIRGRSKANAIITVRAETSGILEQRLVSKGQRVEIGDLSHQFLLFAL